MSVKESRVIMSKKTYESVLWDLQIALAEVSGLGLSAADAKSYIEHALSDLYRVAARD